MTAAVCLPAPAAHAAPAVTHGNFIINNSGHRLHLLSVSDPDGQLQEKPDTNGILAPGARHHTAMTYKPFLSEYAQLVYAVLDESGGEAGRLTVKLRTGPWNQADPDRSCSTTYGECATSDPLKGDGEITFQDPKNTELTYGPKNKNAQAQVLKALCDAGDWKCTFDVRKEEELVTPGKPVGSEIVACNQPVSKDFSVTYTESVTDSFNMEQSFGVKLFEVVETGVRLEENHSVEKSHSYTETATLNVPADYIGWLVAKAPVYRDTGDFTVHIGNTTLHVKDVYFDSPIPGKPGSLTANYLPMTPEEKQDMCAVTPPRPRH
jgi:hypothetical protein